MKNLRKILFPFSILYFIITWFRNFMYDKGFFKSTAFNIPVICVGNLSVGGTGKTPMVEYLIRLLGNDHQIATLSRGYKRKSEGFYLANEQTIMEEIGDEPFQYHSKFKNITVAVDTNRVNGVSEILKHKPNTEIIILDDAFQHRKIKAGFYILLTSFDDLFFKDCLLPAGNLRESSIGVKRADVVVVTKCPANLTAEEQQNIRSKIKSKHVFFSTIVYDKNITNTLTDSCLNNLTKPFMAVAGIAKPDFFFKHLNVTSENSLIFPDHHNFTETDIKLILNKANGRKIITTEKDYMRLQHLIPKQQLFYLPIKTAFLLNEDLFEDKIFSFVIKNTAI